MSITGENRRKIGRVILDWRGHVRPFEDTAYWSKRFAPFEDVFARTRPTAAVKLYRNERTDIDNQYGKRFTSWSWSPQQVEGFGWGQRRMVMTYARPQDILVDVAAFGPTIDRDHLGEVILRPGRYKIVPWRWSMSVADEPTHPVGEALALRYQEHREGGADDLVVDLRRIVVEHLGKKYAEVPDEFLIEAARTEWEKR